MKLSFYVENTNSTPLNMEIYTALNKLKENNAVEDATLFFNNIDFIPVSPKFGLFDSADLWYYTGTVVTTSLDNLMRAASSVNKFKIIHLYDSLQKDLHKVLLSTNHKVITKTEEDQKEYYRLTGVKPDLVENLEQLVEIGEF